ncbi:MAG: CHAT domain-containing protein [Myxococcaceae bacterium]|nr:CHAT domain-containing protein [Myxococcaceae bacterium]
MAGDKEDLETLFARRREIDRALLEHHSREVTILFTDIVGSTQFFETRGDIAGLELVRRHNALLFPIVERHNGWIVKTIGDAIMAVFEDPQKAVACGVQMQRELAEENARGAGEPIHIRIGAHHGRALVEAGKDVFGDAVNLAARVVNEARGDEIVISQALADRLTPQEGVTLIPRGSFQPQGKAAPVPVVRVQWREGSPAAEHKKPAELFVLELQVGARGLKVAALDGAADKGTVKAYADVAVSPVRLQSMADQFDAFMSAGGGPSYVARVKELGETLFHAALSERARRHVAETGLRFLRLHLDDHLVHVPWELMHDGKEFLALRFAVGRVVSARAETSPALRLPSADATHAVVVSNPSGDLEHALREGDAVAGLLRDGYAGEVRHIRGPVTKAALLEALRGCALLHFAGHTEQPRADGPGGFRVMDGLVSPEEVARSVGASAPALVFANGCHASSAEAFRPATDAAPDLASALLLRGSRHFIGPRWEIADADALTFALRFYERALRGMELGEAVRQARRELSAAQARPLSFAC